MPNTSSVEIPLSHKPLPLSKPPPPPLCRRWRPDAIRHLHVVRNIYPEVRGLLEETLRTSPRTPGTHLATTKIDDGRGHGHGQDLQTVIAGVLSKEMIMSTEERIASEAARTIIDHVMTILLRDCRQRIPDVRTSIY